MSSTVVPVNAQPLPSPALSRFAWGVLVYFIAVILWGTLVRATGAGAGCGNHWPLCNGTVMQHSASVNTLIEFVHRLTSGLSFFAVVGLAIWTFTGTVRGHLARAAAVASVVFTLIEATLGALLVKLGLTAQSQSPIRPAYLALHLANTLLLLAALTLTAHLLSRREGYLRGSVRLVAPFSAAVAVIAVMIVGVTGSLAALGSGLLGYQRLAGALALDASHRRVPFEHRSYLAVDPRCSAQGSLGQPQPLRFDLVIAGRSLCTGIAGRGAAGAVMGAGGTPAGRRYAMGYAGGADGSVDDTAERSELAAFVLSHPCDRKKSQGRGPTLCTEIGTATGRLFPTPCSLLYLTSTPAAAYVLPSTLAARDGNSGVGVRFSMTPSRRSTVSSTLPPRMLGFHAKA